MRPRRIQRKRTKGWRMPEGAVYVGRPSVWGNPFRVDGYFPRIEVRRRPSLEGRRMTLTETLEMYRAWVVMHLSGDADFLEPLRGRDLVCWCPTDRGGCHADVLLELANR